MTIVSVNPYVNDLRAGQFNYSCGECLSNNKACSHHEEFLKGKRSDDNMGHFYFHRSPNIMDKQDFNRKIMLQVKPKAFNIDETKTPKCKNTQEYCFRCDCDDCLLRCTKLAVDGYIDIRVLHIPEGIETGTILWGLDAIPLTGDRLYRRAHRLWYIKSLPKGHLDEKRPIQFWFKDDFVDARAEAFNGYFEQQERVEALRRQLHEILPVRALPVSLIEGTTVKYHSSSISPDDALCFVSPRPDDSDWKELGLGSYDEDEKEYWNNFSLEMAAHKEKLARDKKLDAEKWQRELQRKIEAERIESKPRDRANKLAHEEKEFVLKSVNSQKETERVFVLDVSEPLKRFQSVQLNLQRANAPSPQPISVPRQQKRPAQEQPPCQSSQKRTSLQSPTPHAETSQNGPYKAQEITLRRHISTPPMVQSHCVNMIQTWDRSDEQHFKAWLLDSLKTKFTQKEQNGILNYIKRSFQ